GRARDAHVGEGPAEADAAGRADRDREPGARAENGRGGVDARDASEHFRGEAHALEGGAVRAQRDLVLGRTVEEIEYRARQAPLRHGAQVFYVPGAQHPLRREPRNGTRRLPSRSRAPGPADLAGRAHSAFTPEVLMTRAQRS